MDILIIDTSCIKQEIFLTIWHNNLKKLWLRMLKKRSIMLNNAGSSDICDHQGKWWYQWEWQEI